MSDSDKTASSSAKFTERELQLLGWAMQSLKSGPPEIDYDKLAAFAGMGNPRSASNAWAKLKVKLISPASDGNPPATPKKAPRGRKPAASKTDGDESDAATSPKPTPRKRASKRQDVDGESSPKKKPARGKKSSDDETVKAEPEDEDTKPTASPVKAESDVDAEGEVVDEV